MGKRGRKSIAERAARRTDVKDMLMQGKNKQHIVSYMSSNYGIGLSTIESDITAVYLDLKEYIIKHKDDIIGEHIGRYEHIFEICLDVGNTDGAMKALLQKEKLMKLHDAPVAINLQVNNNTLNVENIISNATVEELLKLKEKNDNNRITEDQ
jgi:hypothetical protein